MNLWQTVPLGAKAPEEINVIIEIPKGSANKYEIDKETGMITLDRVFASAQHYPADYGFAPQTLWDDGDPLDVVVLSTAPIYPGILVAVRPVAMMEMIDSGDSDAKIIAVPAKDPRWAMTHDLSDVNPHTLKELKHFFETYKQLENKVCEIRGVHGRSAAIEAVKRAQDLYRQKMEP